MPRYKLKQTRSEAISNEEPGWLDETTEYYGIALLQLFRNERVRLFHPGGEGTVELPREDVELC